jgi:hypothetical protein
MGHVPERNGEVFKKHGTVVIDHIPVHACTGLRVFFI